MGTIGQSSRSHSFRSPVKPVLPPASVSFPGGTRCRQKGCVFPAGSSAGGVCHYHALEESEPKCFRSYQPSRLLLENAKFGIPYAGFVDDRARDRRLLTTMHENVDEAN